MGEAYLRIGEAIQRIFIDTIGKARKLIAAGVAYISGHLGKPSVGNGSTIHVDQREPQLKN